MPKGWFLGRNKQGNYCVSLAINFSPNPVTATALAVLLITVKVHESAAGT
jgi:hypothetical protein